MTPEIYEVLVSFVKGGGRLFMCAAHLNTSERRNGEVNLLNEGDVSELFGCKLDVKRIRRTNAGVKFCKSICEDIIYPADKVFDPLFSSGYANYLIPQISSASEAAVLSDSFYERTSTEGTPVILENRIGDGIAILLTSLDYPGKGETYDLYRTVVRELLSASRRNAKVKVLSSDRVRYSLYGDSDVYLLNTDFDLPSFAVLEKDGNRTECVLAPCELKHIKI
jgi:hypothetical protein